MKFLSLCLIFALCGCDFVKKPQNNEQEQDNEESSECSDEVKELIKNYLDLNDFANQLNTIKQKANMLRKDNNIFTISDLKSIGSTEVNYLKQHCESLAEHGMADITTKKCLLDGKTLDIEQINKNCQKVLAVHTKFHNSINFDISAIAGQSPKDLVDNELKKKTFDYISSIVKNFADSDS